MYQGSNFQEANPWYNARGINIKLATYCFLEMFVLVSICLVSSCGSLLPLLHRWLPRVHFGTALLRIRLHDWVASGAGILLNWTGLRGGSSNLWKGECHLMFSTKTLNKFYFFLLQICDHFKRPSHLTAVSLFGNCSLVISTALVGPMPRHLRRNFRQDYHSNIIRRPHRIRNLGSEVRFQAHIGTVLLTLLPLGTNGPYRHYLQDSERKEKPQKSRLHSSKLSRNITFPNKI